MKLTYDEVIVIDCILHLEICDREKYQKTPTFGGVELKPLYEKWQEIKMKAAQEEKKNEIQRQS